MCTTAEEMKCAKLALSEERVLGEWLPEVIAPGGEVGICIRLNVSLRELYERKAAHIANSTYALI